MSYSFLCSSSENINEIIDESLRKVGSIMSIDRAYVFLFRDNFVINTNEWCSDAVEPVKDKIKSFSLDQMPWCHNQLKDNHIICIPNVSKLPSSSIEKNNLDQQGIKSVLVVPLMFQKNLFGFVGFDSNEKYKVWNEDDIRFIRLFSDIIINAIERINIQNKLLDSNMNLRSEIAKATKKLIEINKNYEEEIKEKIKAEHILLRREKRILEQNRFLLRLISIEAIYTMDLKKPFKIITEGVANIINADLVGIWIFNHSKDQLDCNYFYNRKKPDISENLSIRLSDNPLYFNSVLNGKIIQALDAGKNPVTKSFQNKYFSHHGIKSLLDCPIFLYNDVIGVLSIETLEYRNNWAIEDINFITSLAAIISLCIQNSERLKVQKELKDSQSQYKALFDGSIDSIFLMENEKFVYCNRATEKMYGCSKSDIIGRTPFEFSPEYQPDGSLSRIKALKKINSAQQGEPQVFEWLHCKLDKTPFDAEVSLKKIEIKGRPMIQAVVRDITENKILQEKLFRIQKLESIGKLAGGIAHDFNNILGIILGYASIMEPKLKSDHELHKYSSSIIKECNRASDLISNLLVFSRGGKTESKNFSLNKLISEIIDIIKHTFEKNISIRYTLFPDDIIIYGDYTQIHQVFMNIALNAKDAMPHGGLLNFSSSIVKPSENKILSTNTQDDQFALISITDTGTGMEKGILDRIFDPFFTTKESGKGIGMGLSAVYGIIRKHKGYIDVESEPGQGTTFNIFLPIGKGLVKEDEEQKENSNNLSGKEKILVVDDEKEILNLSKDLFTMYGYEVYTASNGYKAIEIFSENDIDILILDIMMPKMNGIELYNKLKKIDMGIKVIFSSGYSKDNIMKEILKEDNCRFIQKPFSVNNMLSLVRDQLDSN